MNHREQLDKLVKYMNLTNYTIMIAFVALLATGPLLEKILGARIAIGSFIAISLVGIAFIVRVSRRLRCPSCNSSLSDILGSSTGFKMDSRVKFCPYCGLAFDNASESNCNDS